MNVNNVTPLQLSADLFRAPEDCNRFFATLFAVPPMRSVTMIAVELAINESTLNSRFYRAGLPSPKKYLERAFLLRLAIEYETRPRPFQRLVNDFDERSYSPSVARTIRRLEGVSPMQWLRVTTPAMQLAHFRHLLVIPHLETLNRFRPLCPEVTP